MTVFNVKTTAITNLDATPIVANTEGEGAEGLLKTNEGSALMTAAASINSIVQLVRVRSNCKVKKIFLESAAQAAGQVDVGLYYATDGTGGKPLTLLASNAISQAFFASAVIVTGAVVITDITNESGTYTIDKRTQPLWQAVALTSDPGGYFDICATVVGADVTTGAARLGITVQYTD